MSTPRYRSEPPSLSGSAIDVSNAMTPSSPEGTSIRSAIACGGYPQDFVAHGDPAAADDVRAQPGAMNQPAQHTGVGEPLQVVARLAQLLPHALHSADREALADEVVEADAAGEDLPPHLGRRDLDPRVLAQPLERLRLDQRQVARVAVAVADHA